MSYQLPDNSKEDENVFVQHTGSPRAKGKEPISMVLLLCLLLGLLIAGTCNFVLLKIMYTVYGVKYAYFVSQAVNILYLIPGGLVLWPLWFFTHAISVEEKTNPDLRPKFITMGFLDCLGTFLTAMGSTYTPGQFQTLLNQTLIPLTMFASWFSGLETRYKRMEIFGALLILFGAVVTVLPGILDTENENNNIRWYSVLSYFLSNIPMAVSAVYKELSFEKKTIHVMHLTQMVSFWQLTFGFVFLPLQLMIPGISEQPEDKSLDTPGVDLVVNFYNGALCYIEEISHCKEHHAFWLLTGYTIVNFTFNILGLILTKHGSAVLNGFVFALLLPLTTLAFSFPVLGEYTEKVSPFTVMGLLVTLVGFTLFQYFSLNKKGDRSVEKADLLIVQYGSVVSEPPKEEHVDHQDSFQERVIGANLCLH